ncbi:MAG: aldo/keto reductase [Clostridia bacterium]
MKYVDMPGTGLNVSKVCLGTMTFGGQVGEADSIKIIRTALDMGINFVDTADIYTKSESERIVGEALKGRRDNVMDIYYLHRPDDHTPLEETMSTMNDLVRAGKVRYVGISNYPAWMVTDILAICDKRSYAPVVVNQEVYNMVTRGIEDELVPMATRHDMGLIVYNPLASGLLTGKHKNGVLAAGSRLAESKLYNGRYWNTANAQATERLMEIAEKEGMSLVELAFRWCSNRPHVDSVLVGVSKLEQLEQNIDYVLGQPLDAACEAACDQVWADLPIGTRFKYFR